MKVNQAIDICLKVGHYPKRDLDCKEGTPAGDAYEQGWNAALDEVIGRLRAVGGQGVAHEIKRKS